MNRRAFLAAVGCGWLSNATRALAEDKVPRIGFLTRTPPAQRVEQYLEEALRERGYAEGTNVHFEWRRAEHGVMISYSPNIRAILRRGAYYVDRILKGANPSELPVEQVSKPDLIIDLRVAREMGIAVPQELMYRADEVIR